LGEKVTQGAEVAPVAPHPTHAKPGKKKSRGEEEGEEEDSNALLVL